MEALVLEKRVAERARVAVRPSATASQGLQPALFSACPLVILRDRGCWALRLLGIYAARFFFAVPDGSFFLVGVCQLCAARREFPCGHCVVAGRRLVKGAVRNCALRLGGVRFDGVFFFFCIYNIHALFFFTLAVTEQPCRRPNTSWHLQF
ncbi:hypothetical protein TcCL_ESM00210 [Trypanosoma cruzi]|nr:hypothetical protein TcCL_ESM00210 [Trypanosoma cruzi]